MKAIVNTDFLRVRAHPNTNGAVLGLLTQGTTLDVTRVVDGWAQIPLTAGGVGLRQTDTPDAAVAYVFAEFLKLDVEAPPVVTPPDKDKTEPQPEPAEPVARARYALGFHVMSNTHLARAEAERGCRYFMVMNDFGGAGQLKRDFPDAIVMVRRFFDHGHMPHIDQIINGLEGANHGPLVYTALNEADQIGQDGEGLRKRAQLDIEVARRIRQINPGAIYAAGTFSMGTPDFTNAETCQIIREIYAPHYNSGLIALDMHLYSPNMAHIDKPNEWQWFERRWEFLFTKCGFDPNVRAIYCGETGMDEMGVGGFPAHAASADYVRDWCRKYLQLQLAPMTINGKRYASPIRGGALFQLGGNGDPRWNGYEVSSYLPVIREFYGFTEAHAEQGNVRGRNPLPAVTEAARKAAARLKLPGVGKVNRSGGTAAERLKDVVRKKSR
jgi:Bacterial SH3 domain